MNESQRQARLACGRCGIALNRRGCCQNCRRRNSAAVADIRQRRTQLGVCRCGRPDPPSKLKECLGCTFERPCRTCSMPLTQGNPKCIDHITLREALAFVDQMRDALALPTPGYILCMPYKLRFSCCDADLPQHDMVLTRLARFDSKP
jgi:hypothetical protein